MSFSFFKLSFVPLLLLFTFISCHSTSIANRTSNSSRAAEMKGKIINPKNFDQKYLEKLVHDGINQIRKKKRRGLLQPNRVLRNAAKIQNDYVQKRGKLSHSNSSKLKRTALDRVNQSGGGFRTVGENLEFAGFVIEIQGKRRTVIYPSYEHIAKRIVKNWVNSKGHYKNLLHKDFTEVGTYVSIDTKKNGIYATQVFGGNPR